MRKILLVVVSCWLALAAGCADDAEEGGAGGSGAGGAGAGGAGGSGHGGSGGMGHGGAGGMGHGGSGGMGHGGTGGMGHGGAGGMGHGGAGGGGTFPSFAGCTFETAVETTTVVTAGFAYDPPCVKLSAGATLSIASSGTHPLRGMEANGDQPNPISAAVTTQGSAAPVSIAFPAHGSFGFYCANHGVDSSVAAAMGGVVYVQH